MGHCTRAFHLLLTACAGLGCQGDPCAAGGPLPDAWTLTEADIAVEVRRSPYGYTVRDRAGAPVLRTLDGGDGDGYGAVSWAGGGVSWGQAVSAGYHVFEPDLTPWRDRFTVVGAEQAAPAELRVTLSGGGDGGRCVQVRHRLRPGALRVEAQADGEPPRAWGAAFASPAGEGFLGFGERYNRVDQRGMRLYTWAEEGGLAQGEGKLPGPENPFPNGEGMTYYPVPFFLSTKGYGFQLDSTWRSEFDAAAARGDAWRVWHIGPRLDYEVYVPRRGDRPWPYQVLDGFTEATGRPMLPPAWALGPRRRINVNAQKNGVLEIQAMRDLDLALTGVDDAVHFLPSGSDLGREAELRAWVAEARRLGCRAQAYYNPYLTKDPAQPLFAKVQEGLERGYFLREADGRPSEVWLISGRPVTVYTVDLTSAAATRWYQEMFGRALGLGYSGWMYDFGEYVQPGVVAASGMTGEELHNLFPVLYQKAAHDALEAEPSQGDWLTFVRSGYTGSARYAPMVWSGDPDASFAEAGGLPAAVRAGINLSVSGVAHFGSDIGGFKCLADKAKAADGELLTRWIQAGALTSNMQDQDACVGGDGPKASIFTSAEAQAAWRTYARLHTRLFPYLYTLAHEATRSGAPVIRHLFLEHPDRPDLAGVGDEYYFGPALLVAPVVRRGARDRAVRLPAGLYLDWRDQALVRGGGEVQVAAPLDKLPLFLRDGHLVPLLDPSIDTLAEEDLPDVIGPRDVAGVYDVVGLVSKEAGRAAFTLWDGGALEVSFRGGLAPPALPAAADEGELAACAGCYLVEPLAGGLTRVRISASGDVGAGGLALRARVERRVRWDLYLVE